jgi:hypothetical protein
MRPFLPATSAATKETSPAWEPAARNFSSSRSYWTSWTLAGPRSTAGCSSAQRRGLSASPADSSDSEGAT